MVKHIYSPLECCLEIYAARQVVQHSRKNAKHREDQIQAEADLVHFQNHLKECTGIPGEVDSGLSKKEMHAPGQEKSANFKGSAVFHSFWLIFGRAIISWNGLEAWMLSPERARAAHSR